MLARCSHMAAYQNRSFERQIHATVPALCDGPRKHELWRSPAVLPSYSAGGGAWLRANADHDTLPFVLSANGEPAARFRSIDRPSVISPAASIRPASRCGSRSWLRPVFAVRHLPNLTGNFSQRTDQSEGLRSGLPRHLMCDGPGLVQLCKVRRA